jgi:hypothetical protein
VEELYTELRVAKDTDAFADVLMALLAIAENLIIEQNKSRAAEILALILEYPMHEALHYHADMLYDDLKLELCPRVIVDAETNAQTMTLDDMVERILNAG